MSAFVTVSWPQEDAMRLSSERIDSSSYVSKKSISKERIFCLVVVGMS